MSGAMYGNSGSRNRFVTPSESSNTFFGSSSSSGYDPVAPLAVVRTGLSYNQQRAPHGCPEAAESAYPSPRPAGNIYHVSINNQDHGKVYVSGGPEAPFIEVTGPVMFETEPRGNGWGLSTLMTSVASSVSAVVGWFGGRPVDHVNQH
ncbi:hypothetical protein PG997_011521 [Apiospora hydei]|uniref:Uncharacterized protein n=1 Tax=Apiospora hydei TaxID=1337664 RepID=A0ABR1VJC8_9PEZI